MARNLRDVCPFFPIYERANVALINPVYPGNVGLGNSARKQADASHIIAGQF
jgi:hypothetical protein